MDKIEVVENIYAYIRIILAHKSTIYICFFVFSCVLFISLQLTKTEPSLQDTLEKKDDKIVEAKNINEASLNGTTGGESNEKMMDLLLTLLKTSNIEAVDSNNGRTALHMASSGGNEKIVELLLLLVKGANIEALDAKNGRTSLHVAASGGYEKVVELFLKKGANIDAVDATGLTPFHLAVIEGHEKVVELLLSNGAKLERVESKNGRTALHLAVADGNLKLVELLLLKGSRLETIDSNGKTALHIAVSAAHLNVIEYLLLKGANIEGMNGRGKTPLHMAATGGHLNVVEFLLSKGAKIEEVDRNNGWTALHMASLKGHEKVVTLLLSKGANIEAVDEFAGTSLHMAASGGHGEVVELLISNGASTEAVDGRGRTAIHLAATGGYADVVELLLAKGANIEAIDKSTGSTSLHIATSAGHDKVVETLLLHSAKLDTVNKDGLTAFDCCLMCSHSVVSHFLKEYSRILYIKDLPDAINCYNKAFSDAVETSIIHIHMIGDGKGGKSVAMKWLLEMLRTKKSDEEMNEESFIVSEEDEIITLHPEYSRTRGVKTISIRVPTTIDGKKIFTNYLIHDYGGNDEFLINHAQYLSVRNSIYLLVLPLYTVSDNESEYGHLSSVEDVVIRFTFWLKFLYSVAHIERQKYQESSTSQPQLNDNTIATVGNAIPLFPVINRFASKSKVPEEFITNIKDLLNDALKDFKTTNHFHTNDNTDFYIPETTLSMECNSKMENFKLFEQLMMFSKPVIEKSFYTSPVHRTSMLMNILMSNLDRGIIKVNEEIVKIPLLVSRSLFEHYLSIWMEDYFTENVEAFATLSRKAKQAMFKTLFSYSLQSLATLKRIYILSMPIHGLSIVTNPSRMTSSIMGDIVYWYHIRKDDIRTKEDPYQTLLSDNIVKQYLKDVHSHVTKAKKALKHSKKYLHDDMETAIDIIKADPNFPLCDLLITMGLCVQNFKGGDTYNILQPSANVITSTWLVGLSPVFDVNKHSPDVTYPAHANRVLHRTFVLKNPSKQFFIPGYFTRLFAFMTKLPTTMTVEGFWQNAIKIRAFYSGMEILYIVKPYTVLDKTNIKKEGFIVTIAGECLLETLLSECESIIWDYMSCIEVFLHYCMWGIKVEEYCGDERLVMPIADVRKRLFGAGGHVTLTIQRESVWKMYFGDFSSKNKHIVWSPIDTQNREATMERMKKFCNRNGLKLDEEITLQNIVKKLLPAIIAKRNYTIFIHFISSIFDMELMKLTCMQHQDTMLIDSFVKEITDFIVNNAHCTIPLDLFDEWIQNPPLPMVNSSSIDPMDIITPKKVYPEEDINALYERLSERDVSFTTPLLLQIHQDAAHSEVFYLHCPCIVCGKISTTHPGYTIPSITEEQDWKAAWRNTLSLYSKHVPAHHCSLIKAIVFTFANVYYVHYALQAMEYTTTINPIVSKTLKEFVRQSKIILDRINQDHPAYILEAEEMFKHLLRQEGGVSSQSLSQSIMSLASLHGSEVDTSYEISHENYTVHVSTMMPMDRKYLTTMNTFMTSILLYNDKRTGNPHHHGHGQQQQYRWSAEEIEKKTGLQFVYRKESMDAAWVCEECKPDFLRTGNRLFEFQFPVVPTQSSWFSPTLPCCKEDHSE